MMQLAHIALVQWHLFGREDLAVGGDTAVLGQNRSGKSTLIDLIQAKHAALSSEEIVAQFNTLVNEKVLYPGADLGRYSVMA